MNKKRLVAEVVVALVMLVLGFTAGYDYHTAKVESEKVDNGKTSTYSVFNYENGLTMKDGYNMSIHTMQQYVTEDKHCGGLHIDGEIIEE